MEIHAQKVYLGKKKRFTQCLECDRVAHAYLQICRAKLVEWAGHLVP